MNRAELTVGALSEVCDLFAHSNIDDFADYADTALAQFIDDFVERVTLNVGQYQPHSLARRQPRELATEATTRAGDHGNPVGQVFHRGQNSLTSCLPKLAPLSIPRNACGAFSRPFAIVSRYLIPPVATYPPSSFSAAGQTSMCSVMMKPSSFRRLIRNQFGFEMGIGCPSYAAISPHSAIRPNAFMRGKTPFRISPPTFSK